jgi:hypothetical protein
MGENGKDMCGKPMVVEYAKGIIRFKVIKYEKGVKF